jgi:vitamin B12 transporter
MKTRFGFRGLLAALLWPCSTLWAQSPPHVVVGTVIRPGGAPVRAATVELFETEERVTTDSLGQFRLRTAWTGPAMLVARAVGDPPVTLEVALPLDRAVTLVLPRGVPRLVAFTVQPAGEFRLSSASTSEALTPLDVVQTPGAAANVARALQVAPGVNNVDEGTGLFVRGGDVTETRVLVDDVVMISPARFDNPTGHVGATLNPFLLANATLSAGAFGAAYGNALSGVVRMETAGRPTRSSGSLSASIGNASADAALAITPRLGVRLLANVNNLGPLVAVFGEAQPYDPPPRGGDAAVTLEYATSSHSRLRLFTMRQRQQFGVGAADLTGVSPYAATSTEGLTVLSWRDTSHSWRPSVSLGRSRFVRDEALTDVALGTALASDHAVVMLRRAPGSRFDVRLGFEHERFTARYRGTTPAPDSASGTLFDVDTPTDRTGVHAEAAWRVTPWAQLTTGVRADRSDFTQRTTVDPRVAFAMQRGPWGIVTSVGAYHQIPEPILVRAPSRRRCAWCRVRWPSSEATRARPAFASRHMRDAGARWRSSPRRSAWCQGARATRSVWTVKSAGSGAKDRGRDWSGVCSTRGAPIHALACWPGRRRA